MDPRLGRSAFINFSNPNAYVGKFPVISTVSHPTASSQIDVLAHCSSYNLPRGTKRKFDGLSLGLGNSSSSESSKQSMGTGCTISSAKGSDDGSSIDLDLNHFTLGNEGTSRLDKRACDSRRALDKAGLNLELSLSSQSAITGADFTAATEYNSPSLQPYYMDLVPTVDEGSTSARRPSGCQPLLPDLLVHNSAAVAQKTVHTQDEPEVLQGVALLMVGVEGAKKMVVTRELRARQYFVKLMVGAGAANTLDVPRVLKVVLTSA
uniref:Uncharacterized protein n=1 Tax=Oryza punctata TaxID=4537 RepID=A0A0E0JY50_ORYPU